MLRTGKKTALPKPPDYRDEQAQVAALLRNWSDGLIAEIGDGAPEKLIYLLEHAYTPAELGFDTLKNADAAAADVLVAAAQQAGCEIYLALVSIEESGSAEHAYYGGRGRRRSWDDEDEDFEIIDQIFHQVQDDLEQMMPDVTVNVKKFTLGPGEGGKIQFRINGPDIKILRGRYGPYITDGNKNARIPKDVEDPASLDLETCQELIEKAPLPKSKRKKAATRKKAAPKKAAKKKAAKKKAAKKKATAETS